MSRKKKSSSLRRKKDKPVVLSPQVAQIFQQAQAAHNTNRLEEAKRFYRQVVQAVPDFADAYFLLGVLCLNQGALQEAEPMLARACQLKQVNPDFFNALGQLYFKAGNYEEARKAYAHCEKLAPRDTAILASYGACLLKLKQFSGAREVLKRAYALKPDSLEVTNNLGSALVGCHDIEAALDLFKAGTERFPDNTAIRSNFLFNSNYSTQLDSEMLFERHKHAFCASVPSTLTRETGNEKIRLGFVSADFRRHSVAYFFLGLLKHLDRSKFEIYCYYNHGALDEISEQIKSLSDQWFVVHHMADKALHQKLLDEQIDILVDLSGHTQNNRSKVFEQRAAPVQVTWLGYPHSTGIPAMDYRIVDDVTDPAPSADAQSTEQLVRLDGGFLCYEGDESFAESKALPFIENGSWTFGSFNNLAKVNADVVAAWSKILNAVPDSRMIIKAGQLGENCVKAWLIEEFSKHGVSADKLELYATVPDFKEHMRLYDRIDLALDSFPYNGTTTTCEALWMGVPTVSFLGDRHAARVSASILKHVGLDEFVADDVDDYCQKAIEFTKDADYLSTIRSQLRKRVVESSLSDTEGFTRNMESAFLNMVNR